MDIFNLYCTLICDSELFLLGILGMMVSVETLLLTWQANMLWSPLIRDWRFLSLIQDAGQYVYKEVMANGMGKIFREQIIKDSTQNG